MDPEYGEKEYQKGRIRKNAKADKMSVEKRQDKN